jgi:hypothetical protein
MNEGNYRPFGLDIDDPKTFPNLIKGVVILWVLSWIFMLIYGNDEATRGQIGDMFGLANSLFSGLAFAGLFYTILLQKKELHETKQELIEQNKTLKKQRFETTFFNLLKSHEYGSEKNNQTIGMFIEFLMGRLPNVGRDELVYEESYQTSYESYLDNLEPYIKALDVIAAFIINSGFNKEEETFYFYLIHAQLTPNEQTFIQYHSRLTMDRTPGLRDRLRKIVKYAGISILNDDHMWLFSDYDRPDHDKENF